MNIEQTKGKKWIFLDFGGVMVNSFAETLKISQKLSEPQGIADYAKIYFNSLTSYLLGRLSAAGIKEFFAEYDKEIENMKLVNGIEAVLRVLSNKYNLAIVTSAYASSVTNYLKNRGLCDIFVEIVGYEKGLNKAEKMKYLIEKYKCSISDCVFITDSEGDIEEAKTVPVRSVGVCWGANNREILMRGNPAAVVEAPMDLGKAVINTLENE